MKITVANEHKDFLNKEGWIEFDGFFSPTQVSHCNQAINAALATRSNRDQFQAGRDLWRDSPNLQTFISQPKLAQIAYELFNKKPLRLAYDQFFPEINLYNSTYPLLLDQTASLEEVSSIKGLICGMVIGLSTPIKEAQSTPSEGIDVFPNGLGHVIFFLPDRKINFGKLHLHPEQKFYLIVYTQNFSFYQPQLKDPQAYALKQFGYQPNDKLIQKHHPLVYQ